MEVWYNPSPDKEASQLRGKKKLYTFETGDIGHSVCTFSPVSGYSCNNNHQIVIAGTLIGAEVTA